MANRACLMFNFSGDVNEPTADDGSDIAAAYSYAYPVLWWSLLLSLTR
jgi:hypothetical protein